MDLLDKYLSDDSEKKQSPNYKINKSYKKLPTKKENDSIQSFTHKIKIECKNFMVSEYKLISLFSIILAIIFFIFGKNSIRWVFVACYLLGTLLSFLSGYFVVLIGIANCEEILSKSKYFLFK